jgi:hypothetical protein
MPLHRVKERSDYDAAVIRSEIGSYRRAITCRPTN